jgi:hypothetical protein
MNLCSFYLEMVERIIQTMHLGSDGSGSFDVLLGVFVIHYQVSDFGLLVHGQQNIFHSAHSPNKFLNFSRCHGANI